MNFERKLGINKKQVNKVKNMNFMHIPVLSNLQNIIYCIYIASCLRGVLIFAFFTRQNNLVKVNFYESF